MANEDAAESSEELNIYGKSLKRKLIQFVPATLDSTPPPAAKATPNQSLAERYLSITLGGGQLTKADQVTAQTATESVLPPTQVLAICTICNAPITNGDPSEATNPSASETHEASIAHQSCLAHSYPPSHLDRNRAGLKYLSSYGWDPDSRLGLGATGEGIRVPIKAKMKKDKAGLGKAVEEKPKKTQTKVERLDAKGVRKKEAEEKRRGAKLHEMFYASEDVERYLGTG